MKKETLNLSPVLKWVGGKRQLLNVIIPMIPSNISTYCEPFIGGGAVFFELKPKKAIINDYNSELINVYTTIKNNPKELIKELELHKAKNSLEHFYSVREFDRNIINFSKMTNVQKAARIIYLNKTCYNGLYRVNSSGQFNSPCGKYKNPNIVNENEIKKISSYFNDSNNKIVIKNGDFKDALKGLRKGSFVYLDPPYMPISSSASFTGYTEYGFGQDKQIELKMACDKLNANGVKFLQSNSDCTFIRDLYTGYRIKTIKAKRSINSKGGLRSEINEVLIYNYEE